MMLQILTTVIIATVIHVLFTSLFIFTDSVHFLCVHKTDGVIRLKAEGAAMMKDSVYTTGHGEV